MTFVTETRVCDRVSLPEGLSAHEIETPEGPESIILVHDAKGVRAYLNVCPHAGRRLDWSPGRFMLEDGLLICAAHGACFELQHGRCVSGPCRGDHLRAVSVRLEAGAVWVGGPASEATGLSTPD